MDTEAFHPTPQEAAARARADLAMGLPVAIAGADGWHLALAAEAAVPARLAAMTEGGDAVLAITWRRAAVLRVRAYDGDVARLPLAPGATANEVAAISDPTSDLATPLKGPFRSLRGGDAGPARAGIALAKAARRLPAVVLRPIAAVPPGIAVLLTGAPAATLHQVVAADLPMAVAAGRLRIHRPDDGKDEHYAVEVGRPDRTVPVLTRLHSACFTGDVLGSLKCDCGPQLHAALAQMAAAGGGVLLYLNQEGRGIGLANKLRAYALQDQGFDTVDANHRLGFEDDERDFTVGAAMLRDMGISAVRLLTNNPRKVEWLERCGIAVTQRVPLWAGRNPLNAGYLAAKTGRSGHLP